MRGSGTDTIFALASGARKAAIAVYRISGHRAADVVRELSGARALQKRQTVLRTIRDPADGCKIDRALVTWFPGPESFTGEDIVEISVSGGRAVIAAVARALNRISGVRPAEPGEFAYRAFLNAKLDLSSVEGLADLIDAETEQQRIQAERVADGSLRRECDAIRSLLVNALVEIEARIDFSDIDEVAEDEGVASQSVAVTEAIETARHRIEMALSTAAKARRLREGFVVVLAGPPNVGKSTLMNAVVGRDVAITSAVAGTTRDLIEVFVDIRGLPIVFVDTAGIRESSDPTEREGVMRARRRAENADLVLWVSDSPECPRAKAYEATIEVRTKSDVLDDGNGASGDAEWGPLLRVSGRTGAGIEALLGVIADRAEESLGSSEPISLIADRHTRAFEEAHQALCSALHQSESEILAEDIRFAAGAMERVTGRVGVEEVLDGIFGRMCIGK